MSAQIVQFSWENESTPIFTSRENGALSQQRLVFNESFSLEILDGPDCIGFHTREGWVACPYASKGMRKCENCKQKEGLMIEQFCDGYNLDLFSPEDVERLNTPHYLYLALFQRDLFKIGVSAMGRGLLRQIEQGTHYALILAEGMNGILARQIETLLRRSGIPDKIQLAQKKDFLFPQISPAEGAELLKNIAQKHLTTVFFDRPDIKKFFLPEFTFHDFSSYFHLAVGENCPKNFHNIKLAAGESVSGTVLTVKGSLFLLETVTEKVLLSAKDLIGYTVDLQPKPAGLTLNAALQSALF